MSQENVDRFLEVTEAFNRLAATPAAELASGVSGFLEFMDPEIQFEPQQAALQGSYAGRDGVMQWLADIAEHYSGGRIQIADVRDLGDRVLAIGSLRFVGIGSGIEIEVPVAVVASFGDGLITRFKDYGDKDAALEAAGLSD